ncbi:hypothetical protein AURDEDRAFT_154006 [Auricularia subglabra TFB-10046 SS5]|nr:hypothetical protein AURDEDRAFT_154006 [Auricularia subglabra TFB-10046 SS5]
MPYFRTSNFHLALSILEGGDSSKIEKTGDPSILDLHESDSDALSEGLLDGINDEFSDTTVEHDDSDYPAAFSSVDEAPSQTMRSRSWQDGRDEALPMPIAEVSSPASVYAPPSAAPCGCVVQNISTSGDLLDASLVSGLTSAPIHGAAALSQPQDTGESTGEIGKGNLVVDGADFLTPHHHVDDLVSEISTSRRCLADDPSEGRLARALVPQLAITTATAGKRGPGDALEDDIRSLLAAAQVCSDRTSSMIASQNGGDAGETIKHVKEWEQELYTIQHQFHLCRARLLSLSQRPPDPSQGMRLQRLNDRVARRPETNV